MNKKLKSLLPHIAAFAAMALVLLCVISYVSKVNSIYNANLLQIMGKYSAEYTAAITRVMKAGQDNVYYCAGRVAALEDKTDIEKIETILAEQQNNGSVDFLAYGDNTGRLYSTGGRMFVINNSELKSKAENGIVYIGTTQNGLSGSGRAIIICVPVYNEKNVCGYIYGEYPAEKFSAEVDEITGESFSYSVVTLDGLYVLKNKKTESIFASTKNMPEFLKSVETETGYRAENLYDMMKSGAGTVLRASMNGEEYYLNYTPVGINSWYLVIAPKYSQITYQAAYINRNIALLVAEMLAIGAVYYAVSVFINRSRYKQINEERKNITDIMQCLRGGVFSFTADREAQFTYISKSFCDYMGMSKSQIVQDTQNSFFNMVNPRDCEAVAAKIKRAVDSGEVCETKYRVKKADGETAWLFQRAKITKTDGKDVVFAVVIDITENQNMKAELTESKETFDFLLENMNNITFEWNEKENKVKVSKLWMIKMGYKFPDDFLNSAVTMKNVIYTRDLRKFVTAVNMLFSGKKYVEEVVRIQREDGSCVWCRLCMSGMRYRAQKPTVITGVIVDIDKTRREIEHMQSLAEKDSMTGLYNKAATQLMITECIRKSAPGERHAFMMIDLDNFKMVNDRFGHAYGDAAIIKLAHLTKSIFRTTDIIGRIGGDEFVVFLKNVDDNAVIEEKAEALCKGMNRIEARPGSKYMLSVTVGVSFYGSDAENYDSLYKAADTAMYIAKSKGKNRWEFYKKNETV